METFSALLAFCALTGYLWIPVKRPVARSFDVFFDLRLNERLSKEYWGWSFERPSLSLWRHCYDYRLNRDELIESEICLRRIYTMHTLTKWPLSTRRNNLLLQNDVKIMDLQIWYYDLVVKFDRLLGNTVC